MPPAMIDRRTLLQALAAFGASALAPGAHAQSLDAAAFAKLSAALTGYPQADPGTAAKVMRAFATPQRIASLRTLATLVVSTPASDLDAAIAAKKLDKVANDLVAAWYSGMVDGKVVLYTDALVWSAMTYSKPMGICGGVTGYWADPWTPT
jgi:hypothetical protein